MKGMFKRAVAAVGAVAVLGTAGIIVGGCLDRDVVSRAPTVNTVVTRNITNNSIDKVDLLFMIDNSASMGDKQTLLALAVPNMINRLVTPNCVDGSGNTVPGAHANPDGSGCPANDKPEFPPVHDMHIGIVTSSLGSRGGNVCPDNAPSPVNSALSAHNNDNGELINRGGLPNDPTVENVPGTPDAPSPLNFLSYFPSVTANQSAPKPPTPAVVQPATLISDFTTLIEGVHEHGCGFEAQNEAWYRFLVQPDPFATIGKDKNGLATLQGIDATILKQRANFLRPDSLLAVIVVTDENEEAADPLSIGRQGFAFDTMPFPSGPTGAAPEGTIECKNIDINNPATTGPNDPKCQSCAFIQGAPNFTTECPNDLPNGASGYLDPSHDAVNLRFFNQKQRFGLFAGYPTTRYVRGLQKASVPSVGLSNHPGDTDHEHDGNGNYIGDQDSQANCVNPIYAQNLPTDPTADLCALTPGPRTPDLVYYAAIAGVPHQLLQQDPTNPSSPQKDTLSAADWTLIMGQDPEHYDFRGADFHMVESPAPRTTNGGGWANAATCSPQGTTRPPGLGGPGADPINGCEFNTTFSGSPSDLQFACIFPLIDGSSGTIQNYTKDCTQSKYSGACDCVSGSIDNASQLCDPTTSTNQIFAKAYPSVREMIIAKAMSNEVVNGAPSNQGIVSSLCPIKLDVGQSVAAAQADPLFGYNPAVNAIISRLKVSLNSQCFSQQLNADPKTGAVSCLVLVARPAGTGGGTCTNPGAACDPKLGLIGPSTDPNALFQQSTLDKFCADHSAKDAVPYVTADMPVCALQQVILDPSNTQDCSKSSSQSGWCYVTGAGATALGCTPPNTIVFTSGEPPGGSLTSLECLENAVTVVDAGGGGGGGGGG